MAFWNRGQTDGTTAAADRSATQAQAVKAVRRNRTNRGASPIKADTRTVSRGPRRDA